MPTNVFEPFFESPDMLAAVLAVCVKMTLNEDHLDLKGRFWWRYSWPIKKQIQPLSFSGTPQTSGTRQSHPACSSYAFSIDENLGIVRLCFFDSRKFGNRPRAVSTHSLRCSRTGSLEVKFSLLLREPFCNLSLWKRSSSIYIYIIMCVWYLYINILKFSFTIQPQLTSSTSSAWWRVQEDSGRSQRLINGRHRWVVLSNTVISSVFPWSEKEESRLKIMPPTSRLPNVLRNLKYDNLDEEKQKEHTNTQTWYTGIKLENTMRTINNLKPPMIFLCDESNLQVYKLVYSFEVSSLCAKLSWRMSFWKKKSTITRRPSWRHNSSTWVALPVSSGLVTALRGKAKSDCCISVASCWLLFRCAVPSWLLAPFWRSFLDHGRGKIGRCFGFCLPVWVYQEPNVTRHIACFYSNIRSHKMSGKCSNWAMSVTSWNNFMGSRPLTLCISNVPLISRRMCSTTSALHPCAR